MAITEAHKMAFFDGDIREKFHNLRASDEKETDWEAVISIGTAARMVNLSVSALRKYEKEGLLIYSRTETGRRLLSQADLQRIRMIQHMINDIGLNMEGIRRLLALLPCWELRPCGEHCSRRETAVKCRARFDPERPCWMLERSECACAGENCRDCNVYRYGAYCAETMKSLLHDVGKSDTHKTDT
jgi:MerR family transcriptional regulator/heat shock protein HspR